MTRPSLQIKRLKALVRASRFLNTSLQLDVVLETFLKTALEALQSEHGTVYLINAGGTELASFTLASGEESSRSALQSIQLPLGEGIAGHVARSGRPEALRDPYADPRFHRDVDQRSGVRTRNLLTVPILNESRETIGVMQVLNHPVGYHKEDIQFLMELSSQAAVAIERSRMHTELLEKSRLEKELDIARQIQEHLLPPIALDCGTLQVASFSHPCYQVGGDFFDLEEISPGKFALACGDVCGKGVPAALLNSLIKASYRHLLPQEGNPKSVLTRMNGFIQKNTTDNRFCTMVVVILDLQDGKLVHGNAGHNFPLLVRADGSLVRMEQGGIPLGLLPVFEYEDFEQPLGPGDTLLLYSDGVTEAVDPAGEEFGEQRLAAVLQTVAQCSAGEGVKRIRAALEDFTRNVPQADDITMLLCRVL